MFSGEVHSQHRSPSHLLLYIGLITKAKKLNMNGYLSEADRAESPPHHGGGLRGLSAFPGGVS
jgi:hypothetical protein